MNKQIFYGQYKRIGSYFDGTETCMASGSAAREGAGDPRDREAPRCRPKSSPRPIPIRSAAVRKPCATICARRCALLKEAGYEVRDRKLVDVKTGKPLTVEILSAGSELRSGSRCSTSRRWNGSASPSASAWSTDAQYQNRLRSFDFDMIIDQWGESLSPGNEQREFWGSQGRRHAGCAQHYRHQEPGGRRVDRAGDLRQGPRRAGRRDPRARPRAAVESLRRAAVDLSDSRATPAGTVSAMPSRLPKYGRSGLPTLWWYDAEKAARIGKSS